jgi:hypothetical protein
MPIWMYKNSKRFRRYFTTEKITGDADIPYRKTGSAATQKL